MCRAGRADVAELELGLHNGEVRDQGPPSALAGQRVRLLCTALPLAVSQEPGAQGHKTERRASQGEQQGAPGTPGTQLQEERGLLSLEAGGEKG